MGVGVAMTGRFLPPCRRVTSGELPLSCLVTIDGSDKDCSARMCSESWSRSNNNGAVQRISDDLAGRAWSPQDQSTL